MVDLGMVSRDGAALRAMGSADPYEKLKILH
jgi:hypothetical protein